MPFTNLPNPAPAYVDDNVPFASFTADIKSGPVGSPTTVLAAAIFENFRFNTPANKIRRPNQIGGKNGFVLVNTQEEGSGTVQYPTPASSIPKNGNWFQIIRDPVAGTVETWVLHDIGDAWENSSYRKHEVSASLALNPP